MYEQDPALSASQHYQGKQVKTYVLLSILFDVIVTRVNKNVFNWIFFDATQG